MRKRQNYVVVVIPISEIKKFVIIDLVASTALYYIVKFPLHSMVAATASSMLGPYFIRKSMQFSRRSKK
jgi:hypothetical protein